LNGRYTRSSCPAYLKPEGFQALKLAKTNNAFKLHTDTILKCADFTAWRWTLLTTVACFVVCRTRT
jgi:hypothetical protein